jgi:tricorn protease
MLINGWAGSGGDAFPWAFKTMNMGPIIGERTLGILVGPATRHGLIDGSSYNGAGCTIIWTGRKMVLGRCGCFTNY